MVCPRCVSSSATLLFLGSTISKVKPPHKKMFSVVIVWAPNICIYIYMNTLRERERERERETGLLQVADNICHTTFCGVFGRWYFGESEALRYHAMRCDAMLCYAMLCYNIILCYAMLYCTILYYTILCHTIPYYTILYYTVLYCTVLYCTVLYFGESETRGATIQVLPLTFMRFGFIFRRGLSSIRLVFLISRNF